MPKHAAESRESTVTVVGGLWPTERRQPPGQAPAKARARDIAPVTSMYDESQRLSLRLGVLLHTSPVASISVGGGGRSLVMTPADPLGGRVP